jgi:hypothetical protein
MAVTVPGGPGVVLYFNVSGSAAINYANDFANAVGLNPAVTNLSSGDTETTVAGALNTIFSNGSSLDYSLTTGGQYTFVSVGAPTTVNGSAAGGDVVVGGGDLIYVENGTSGGSNITFTDGNNIFDGSSVGGAGDTIAGGSGNDTINTGAGPSTVFSGTGRTLINLYDTVTGDVADMQNGNSTVNAFGVADTVVASATGTIFGGTGALTFVGQSTDAYGNPVGSLDVTIVGGTGDTNLFGAATTDLVFSNAAGSTAQYMAGAGNETLNGANAAGGFSFFGDLSTVDGGSINDTVVGGVGNDYFSTGSGVENLFAGSGAAQFEINTVGGAGATITISDFSAADSVNFAGLSVAQETSLLGTSSSVSDGNLTVTLQDGTKVEFVGITSLTGHLN